MSKKFWLSRDGDGEMYNIHSKEPDPPDESGSFLSDVIEYYTSEEVKTQYGITLNPGEFVQVEIKEVGDRYEY